LGGHQVHDSGINSFFLLDQLEYQDADEGSTLAWDASGWVGGDINRLWVRSEGERTNGVTEDAELQLLYGRSVSPWWDVVAGVRQDFKPESPQTWAAFGIQGMACMTSRPKPRRSSARTVRLLRVLRANTTSC
jgi:copper resistance protein B